MKRRIILKPSAVFDNGEFYRATIERYVDGAMVGAEESPHAFPTEQAAEQFADACAAGVVDELIKHYGDKYSFTIIHPPARNGQPVWQCQLGPSSCNPPMCGCPHVPAWMLREGECRS